MKTITLETVVAGKDKEKFGPVMKYTFDPVILMSLMSKKIKAFTNKILV